MTKRSAIIAATVTGVILLVFMAGIGISALLSGGSSQSVVATTTTTTPVTATLSQEPTPVIASVSPSDTPTIDATSEATDVPSTLPTVHSSGILPAPAFGSLASASTEELFGGKLVIQKPQVWTSRDSDGDSQTYADTTTCASTNLSDCPHVTFLRLTGPNQINFGTNPIATWAKDVCPSRSSDAVEGPVAFLSGGVKAGFYRLPCQGMMFYAWYVPSKSLIVLGSDGGSNPLEASIVQAVVERAQF